MDGKMLADNLDRIAEESRESLKTNAIAFIAYIAEGKFLDADYALQEALLAYWRVMTCKHEREHPKGFEENNKDVIHDVTWGKGLMPLLDAFMSLLAQHRFREIDAAQRAYCQPGEKFDHHTLNKLYQMLPDLRHKLIDSYSPTISQIHDGVPCEHDTPLICDYFGDCYICTTCHVRFPGKGRRHAGMYGSRKLV